MESKSKSVPVTARIIKNSDLSIIPTVYYDDMEKQIEKSDKTEQLNESKEVSPSLWINHPIDMRGLKKIVIDSTILPQCIKAYKNNISGFGIKISYKEDFGDETPEMIAEWDKLKKIVDLFNMDMQTKEIFENIVESREKYGIAYCEVIRNFDGEVVELQFITNTPSIDMTYPLEPYMDTTYYYNGDEVIRKKKFRKFRQTVAGKTVYFREFGDPRVMDKTTGEYVCEADEQIDIDNQANEIIEFRIGSDPYGEVRWIGQVLTVDGNRRAEVLNNNYFRKGRHTPLMIAISGGTLTDEAYTKLQEYMNSIEGESGQHGFLVLEMESKEPEVGFTEQKKPMIEIKDMASILQNDELFQAYLENGRKKVQSAFLLPDLYTGYTTDFNRSTAQMAMEVTEKQVFQPERESLAWIINNRILNAYNFKYVQVGFSEPDITNPDDIQKILNITERSGGISPNLAKEYTYKVLGKDGCENYEGDWGEIPLAYCRTATQSRLQDDLGIRAGENPQTQKKVLTKQVSGAVGRDTMSDGGQKVISDQVMQKMEEQIQKASENDAELVTILKEIRKALTDYSEKAGD